EDHKIRINALNEVPELKRLFEGYNMHWIAKISGKYSMEMMEAMKGIGKLSTEEKLIHFRWMANIIVEDKEEAEWVTSRNPIYKASLNFLARSWWSIVRHRLAPTVNDNVLSAN
ncbi:hypothetical protein HAX54_038947, partial [Datura stramonium]|nr:hypothetical protein [Datura stramonium]